MKLGHAVIGFCSLLSVQVVSARERQIPQPYKVVHGWPQLPQGRILGQATGVDVDSHGNVFVFHRAGRTWAGPSAPDDPSLEPIEPATVEVFDGRSGRHLRSWGANRFLLPHGLTIDGHDNLWLTDVGLHQVFKFSPDGKLLLTIGVARVAGADRSHFNMPTDVAVLSDGSFYVSDGYRNTRVIKFSARGEFLFEWGRKGAGPGEFDLPHAVDVDTTGRVYVADRSNGRIQIFDKNGKFLAQWRRAELGRPFSISISGKRAIVVDGGDTPGSINDHSGASEVSLDGRVMTRFGGFGLADGQFRVAHDVAVSADGLVFVVDAFGQRIQKFTRRSR
jgi:peptidylamidoglycolate lyase